MLGRSLKQLTPKQLGDEDEIDEDVRAEADRVVVGGADEDVVKVRRLRSQVCVPHVVHCSLHGTFCFGACTFPLWKRESALFLLCDSSELNEVGAP